MLAPEPLKNSPVIIKAKLTSIKIPLIFEEKLLFQDTLKAQLLKGIQQHRCVSLQWFLLNSHTIFCYRLIEIHHLSSSLIFYEAQDNWWAFMYAAPPYQEENSFSILKGGGRRNDTKC